MVVNVGDRRGGEADAKSSYGAFDAMLRALESISKQWEIGSSFRENHGGMVRFLFTQKNLSSACVENNCQGGGKQGKINKKAVASLGNYKVCITTEKNQCKGCERRKSSL